MSLLNDWFLQTLSVVNESAPWLIGGFLLSGLLHQLVPKERIERHLGRGGALSVLKATLIGMPLPLCSCSVIPMAASMRRRGASRGATAGFLVSTPETGVDSIAITYALLGPFLAIVRPVAALMTALLTGTLIDWTDRSKNDGVGIGPTDDPACSTSCCQSEPRNATRDNTSLISRVVEGVRFGLVEMLADLSIWLVIGFVLAGWVTVLIPDDFFGRYLGGGFWTMLIMVLAGMPTYVCATSSTPVAAALIAQGLSPGAAMVFLLAGPATNVATMGVVGRELGWSRLVTYLLCISVIAVLTGLGTDLLIGSFELGNVVADKCTCTPTGQATVFAVIMIALMLNGLRVRFTRR